MTWLWIYSAIVTVGLGVAIFFAVRFAKRLLQLDEVLELLSKDVHYQAQYCDKLSKTPLFFDSDEVRDLVKYTRIIRDRMNEFCMQIQEQTGKSYVFNPTPQPQKPLGPRPVVVD